MVMIEALATGTPVVVTPAGSVPEIVTNGVNGFIRTSERELADAACRAGRLDRSVSRRTVADNFSLSHMVQQHVRLFDAASCHGTCRISRVAPNRSDPSIRTRCLRPYAVGPLAGRGA